MNGISIIIPLYNKENTITTSLDKILDQTVDSFEVIVVNDGSTDGSLEKIKQYEDRITLISQKNQGPSVARNNGARNARFECLSFIDADDEILPNFVESHLSVRQHDPDVELSVNSFRVYENGILKRTERLFDRSEENSLEEGFFVLDEFHHSYVINIHSGGYCVNKELFLRMSGFDEALRCWEITDALTRFSLGAKKVAVINDILSQKYDTDNSLFKLEKENFMYQYQYCENILSIIEQLPDHSKTRYFNEIEYLIYDLWKSLQFRKLMSLYYKATSLPSADRFFSLPWKVKLGIKVLQLFYSPNTE